MYVNLVECLTTLADLDKTESEALPLSSAGPTARAVGDLREGALQ